MLMCTVTSFRNDAELLVTMNRDEALVRGAEIPPAVHAETGHSQWIAPADSDKGGTWMGVNEHGVVACLLNAYLPGESLLPDHSHEYRSRGEIIPEVMAQASAAESLRWVRESLDPASYPSFNLFVFTPDSGHCFTWYRQSGLVTETIGPQWHIRTSSGWDSDDVTQWRNERFAAWQKDGCATVGTLPTFHLLRVTGEEERSPLMLRSWSSTRSITQARVELAKGHIELRYWGTPEPDSKEPSHTLSLPLAGSTHTTGEV
ncbi:MAG: NRDE family protein [Candidatus Hydrogenedentes bacterium]|nr:NRDE family protein [Candidatus Hydrogenedentota bacterium]